jgi:hypothetical protein
MKKFYCILAGLLAVFPASATVQASIFDNMTGVVSWLEDDDAEGIIGGDGDTQLEVGEFLVSVAQFNFFKDAVTGAPSGGLGVGTYDQTTRMATAVSLIKVLTAPAAGPGFGSYTFEAPSALEWSTLLPGLPYLPPGDDTTLLVYDDPIPAVGSPHIDATGTVATGTGTATDGTLIYEFGITQPGAFQSAQTGSATDVTNILAISTLQFDAALDLINNFGGPALNDHNFLATSGLILPAEQALFAAAGAHELQFRGTNGPGLTVPNGGVGGFQLSTETDAFMSVVPEPAAVLVWPALIVMAGAVVWFYNRRQFAC